jgi:peroxiredoxin
MILVAPVSIYPRRAIPYETPATMKSAFIVLICLAFLANTGWSAKKQPKFDLASELPPDAHRLKIGDPAPEFSLQGVNGHTYSLADFKDPPVLMVIFLSNHCPYSHAAETRLLPLYAEFRTRGLAVVAINPNSPESVGIYELGYSHYTDSFDDMKLYAKERSFTFPYLYDGATQATAKAYGALCTPDVFIFDQARRLRYMGHLDDSPYAEANTVTSRDARNAVEAILAGRAVPVAVTKPFGCSVKWLENRSSIAKINDEWVDTPVTQDPIDAAGVAALVRNDTAQLRLINVWATWCVPCVEEFPNLVTLIRQFQNRNLEVITISVDAPKDQPAALQFLQRQHAALPHRLTRVLKKEGRSTNNYIFAGNLGDLQAALDSAWPGPVPYTLLIAPGGKILYRHVGAINLADMRTRLVDQLTPYYNPATNN